MKLSISSVRKTIFIRTLFIIYSPSLCLHHSCFHSSADWGRSLFQLNQSDSVSHSSHSCQSFKSVPCSAAVSSHFNVWSIPPHSPPVFLTTCFFHQVVYQCLFAKSSYLLQLGTGLMICELYNQNKLKKKLGDNSLSLWVNPIIIHVVLDSLIKIWIKRVS